MRHVIPDDWHVTWRCPSAFAERVPINLPTMRIQFIAEQLVRSRLMIPCDVFELLRANILEECADMVSDTRKFLRRMHDFTDFLKEKYGDDYDAGFDEYLKRKLDGPPRRV